MVDDVQIMSGSGVRRLTPTECERLQAFPDGWTAGQSDSARYKQLGNAVTVSVAQWLGERIIQLGKESTHDIQLA
jgi:DNA (cytosine-5)-methyltransferase 1